MNEPTDDRMMHDAYMKWLQSGGSFVGVYEMFPTYPQASVRRKIYEYDRRLKEAIDPQYIPPAAKPHLLGTLDDIQTRQEQEEYAWELALKMNERRKKQRAVMRHISFDYGPIAIAFFADLHLGNYGTDYERLDEAIDIVNDTPGMYIITVGDFIDNYIIGKLNELRKNESQFTVENEWALARRVIRKMAPRLIGAVAGNHDKWTKAVAGIDYFQDINEQIVGRNILYDSTELRATVHVGDAEFPLKIRHNWRGHSDYNITHGPEKDSKFNAGYWWRLGVGAHTHAAGAYREFNNAGKSAATILVGTFKVDDSYALDKGFPESNKDAVVSVVMDADGDMIGSCNLRAISKYMKKVAT